MSANASWLEKAPSPWRERLAAAGRTAAAESLTACLVGGCVRDLMLGAEPKDWDVLVEGRAGPLVKRLARDFHCRVVEHPAFLTFTLHFEDGTALDVATAREETYPRPAALPVVKPSPLARDFVRRDFTVNAMALHLSPDRWGTLEDPLGGRADLSAGFVRALHPKSFEDDPTRIYRAARYAGRYGWRVEEKTRGWIDAAVKNGLPALLSPARRRNELIHLLEENDPGPAMKMLWDWGLWPFWGERWRWSDELFSARSAEPRLESRLAALCRGAGVDPVGFAEDIRKLTFSKKMISLALRTAPRNVID